MTSPSQGSPLILLHSDDLREASDWKRLNDPWISAEGGKICSFSFAGGAFQCTDMATREPGFPIDGIGDLLLCSSSWNLTPKWRETVRQAIALFPVKSITGRRLVESARPGPFGGPEDKTPAMLSEYVTEWNLSGAIHGVGCRRLPHDLLWISAEARPAMFHCLAMSSSLSDAVDRFYDEALIPRNFGKNLYLPDFVAFHR
jgi:hypothetical protein